MQILKLPARANQAKRVWLALDFSQIIASFPFFYMHTTWTSRSASTFLRIWHEDIDEQKAWGPVARPKHGRPGTAQARHGPEDTGPGLGTARVPGRAWAARQARRVARHGPQLVEGTVEAR